MRDRSKISNTRHYKGARYELCEDTDVAAGSWALVVVAVKTVVAELSSNVMCLSLLFLSLTGKKTKRTRECCCRG